jgi:8-oxo-dGTP pyrophosphatase MutT (NUDIX family)
MARGMVGGKRKDGEKILTCLKRETVEEVGVAIDQKSAQPLASVDFYDKHPSGHNLGWRVHYFLVRHWIGNPRLISEFSELRWFPHGSLPYEEMLVDRRIWLPFALSHSSTNVLQVEIFYGDERLSSVDKGSFSFGPCTF